jgi:hypothetical protein
MKNRVYTASMGLILSVGILSIGMVGCSPAVAGPDAGPTDAPMEHPTVVPTQMPTSPGSDELGDGAPVTGWYGRVVSASQGTTYDDYLILLPEGTGEVGIQGADEAIEAEIERLRDADAPVHVWGALLRDVPDHGGYQLVVDRLRFDGSGEVVETEVDGLEVIVASNPEGAQTDDYVQLVGAFGARYGIEGADPEITRRLDLVRDTLTPVEIGGTLACGVLDVNGCRLDAQRLLLVGEPLAPTPTPERVGVDGEPVKGWIGTVVDLPPGNQFGQVFEREDGEEFGLGTPTDDVRERVSEARSTGARVRIWGTLHTGVPADEARTIVVERIEYLSEPGDEGEPVDGWTGAVHKLPPGNQFGRRFIRDDGEVYGIATNDDAIREQLAEASWTGAHIQVWGELHTGVPDSEARQIVVDHLGILSTVAPEARYLSPFAEVSASSHLPSDRYGTYGPYAAIDGSKETAWVEGTSNSGVGEWIQLTFPGRIELHAVGFDVGFDRDADLFAKNNRVKRATLVFSNGERTTVDFEDSRGVQDFAMVRAPGPNLETTFVKLIIDEVYPGTTYDDTCVAEIEVWGVVK